ncbi:MAG TPA: O-antigen ligase family protein [Sphingomicrobium sp.]|nr:O-antigen ligase family protein [Sphingomicrobium sp.]
MIVGLRRAVAPAYLFLCLLLGGSGQGAWGNALLQLLAVALIAWALIERRSEGWPSELRPLLLIIALVIGIVLLHLIPLPAYLWQALPGRQPVSDGLGLLGLPAGAMPLSLAPYASLASLLSFLPPLGMVAAIVGLRAYSAGSLAAALVLGAVAGVLLGIMQMTSPVPEASPWYFYRHTNFGVPTGFFANGNHMAALLVVILPFIAALGGTARDRAKDVRLRWATLALVGGGLLIVVLGLVLSGSLAGYGLGVPTALASVAMVLGRRWRFGRGGAIAIGLVGMAAVAFLMTRPVQSRLGNLGADVSVASRQTILAESAELARQYMPAGSGLGTFAAVYRMNEDPAKVDRTYVNHAHNDYVELAIELGLAGVLLILLFLSWWAVTVTHMLKSPAASPFAHASAIATAALLLHSLVDFPLRTAALSTVFAMCLALIMVCRRGPASAGDLRPPRHLVVP